jgi:membrane protein
VASPQERLGRALAGLRARRPFVDHAVRMQQHYGAVKAGQQSGAVTYFGFLSFFPILALSFFVVGYVAHVYPAGRDNLRQAIDQLLPGLIGSKEGRIRLGDIQDAANAVGLLGLAGVVYSGLGWLSAMRDALVVVFELPARDQPNFLLGKLRDLVTLALIGVILMVSVAVSGFVSGFAQTVLGWVGLNQGLEPLLQAITVLLGLAANALLFFSMFRLLAEPRTPARSLWQGALLGAVGFELLKRLSGLLLASTKGQPAFQAFGIALILLVWINYFSRVVLYAAAWAHTSREARAQRYLEPADPIQGPQSPRLAQRPPAPGAPAAAAGVRRGLVPAFAAGAGAALALVALLRRTPEEDR